MAHSITTRTSARNLISEQRITLKCEDISNGNSNTVSHILFVTSWFCGPYRTEYKFDYINMLITVTICYIF
jgi:hypothetical protein